ncbi:hypothetical protein [Soonwooa sp.]|uniref:hypothetical protein n=1 Tax=Soonwooa sp. TaxID=1938592 RepID=UPI0028AAFC56|nr:hypothetical protein [Soonwooa sp.]
MKNKVQQTMLALSMLTFGLSYAQESRDLSVYKVMDLALQNHQQLKVSAKNGGLKLLVQLLFL